MTIETFRQQTDSTWPLPGHPPGRQSDIGDNNDTMGINNKMWAEMDEYAFL